MSKEQSRSTPRRESSKQKVLRHFPGSVCYIDKFGRYAISTGTRILGGGTKERAAWIDAAKGIR